MSTQSLVAAASARLVAAINAVDNKIKARSLSVQTQYVAAGPLTLANSAARTSLLPAATSTTGLVVAPNQLRPGDALFLEGWGSFSTGTLNIGSLTFWLSLGGLDLASVVIANPLLGGAGPFAFRLYIYQRAGTLLAVGQITYGANLTSMTTVGLNITGAEVATNTVSNARAVSFDAKWSLASTANTISVYGVRAEIIKGS